MEDGLYLDFYQLRIMYCACKENFREMFSSWFYMDSVFCMCLLLKSMA
jgi:hypothetical protein